jgi:hypothetical protein
MFLNGLVSYLPHAHANAEEGCELIIVGSGRCHDRVKVESNIHLTNRDKPPDQKESFRHDMHCPEYMKLRV